MDYEDFLRQRGLPLWPEEDTRRKALVARRCSTAEEVAAWVKEVRDAPRNPKGQGSASMPFMGSMKSSYAAVAANAAHVLVGVACALLDRQIERLAADFEREGGFTERLYRIRSGKR